MRRASIPTMLAVALVATAALSACAARQAPPLATPLEASGFAGVTSSARMNEFLRQLAAQSQVATLQPIGESALGAPMFALVLSREPAALATTSRSPTRPTVLLVGSQHGTEPSGGEALLRLAREVATGPGEEILAELNLVLIPNGNPDGRDGPRRVNGNGVNLSTNFTVLSEPEARAVDEAIARWQPDALLDVHESAIFKGKTLARQGYLTDFEAQFEVANHPNVDPGLAALTQERLLPEVLQRVNTGGLRAHRYFGEITDVEQPITHGGLSLKNLRNRAGMLGTVSFLVENRLDPKEGDYPTPRNLGARVDKQYASILAFLDVVRAHRAEVVAAAKAARERARTDASPLQLVSAYGPDPAQPEVKIRLQRVDTGEIIERTFAYHGQVRVSVPLEPPAAYVVTAHQKAMRRLLDRHHVTYEVRTEPSEATLVVQRIRAAQALTARHGWDYTRFDVEERSETKTVPAGSLVIPLTQPAGRILPLLLDPRSNSSIFQEPAYAPLVRTDEDFFIVRMPRSLLDGTMGEGSVESARRSDAGRRPRSRASCFRVKSLRSPGVFR
jgi:hypothetical protein